MSGANAEAIRALFPPGPPNLTNPDPHPTPISSYFVKPQLFLVEAPSAEEVHEKLRVLVVDDEPTIRGVIAQVLRLDGHDATEAASAEEGLAAFRARPFPVVLTDVVMGGMNGLQLLREITSIEPETLVVIMTSQASLETATAALRAGAYDFLTKPFDDLFMITALIERANEKLLLQTRNRLLTKQLEMYAGELERLNKGLKGMAERDWLTGLLNRRRLHSGLEEELARAERQGGEGSVIMLDVDHFKKYNDQHGHLAGDEVLRGVAKLLVDSAAADHVCARYGGEEVVLLLPGADRSTAMAQAEKIRHLVETFPFEGRETQPAGIISVSVGVASFPEGGATGDAVLGRADDALYRAKEKGRNRVEG